MPKKSMEYPFAIYTSDYHKMLGKSAQEDNFFVFVVILSYIKYLIYEYLS